MAHKKIFVPGLMTSILHANHISLEVAEKFSVLLIPHLMLAKSFMFD